MERWEWWESGEVGKVGGSWFHSRVGDGGQVQDFICFFMIVI